MDFPAPGGPISNKLCAPAAAISSARRAESMPRTWARSAAFSTVAIPPNLGRVSNWVPRKWLIRASRSGGARISTSPAHAASPPCDSGQISPKSAAPAAIAAGNTPATGCRRPSSDNSPRAANSPASSIGTTSIAASTASAIGRSKCEPSFSISAGARLMTMRLGGRDSPIDVSAARTRSRASPTALSGNPTTRKFGRPEEICTCTSTFSASIPAKLKVLMRATVT